ncbi:MAG: hypothetical protein ACPLRW_11935 [Moorellales bacterium]
MGGKRRIKKRKQLMEEALARGVSSIGGLVWDVYRGSPRDRQLRARVVKMRHELRARPSP